MVAIVIISIIGVLLSVYAYYVERKNKDKDYRAICDVSDKISCSKALTSSYGKLIGVSNSLIGILFYIFIIVLNYTYFNLIIYFALGSVIGSAYLGYLQFFKLKSFCFVCSSIYIVNILLLVFSII